MNYSDDLWKARFRFRVGLVGGIWDIGKLVWELVQPNYKGSWVLPAVAAVFWFGCAWLGYKDSKQPPIIR